MQTRDVIDHYRAEPGYWFVPKLFGIGVALIAVFTVIAVRKTKGGWRWRWGLPG